MSRADEIKLDIDDLNSLLEQAQRQRSKDLISIEIRRLQTEFDILTNKTEVKVTPSVQRSGPKVYEVKLNNYGWDQTDKFMKIYVTLKNVHTLPKEAVTCNFTDRSMDLRVLGLDSKNYHLPIINLCEEIDTEKSNFKVKTDLVAILLAKKMPVNWSHVTGVEKRIKESKAPLVPEGQEDDLKDPGSSLMSMMKKMYQDGDDDMKKTIAKAWCESQDKKGSIGDMI